jgi:hypothetical protein
MKVLTRPHRFFVTLALCIAIAFLAGRYTAQRKLTSGIWIHMVETNGILRIESIHNTTGIPFRIGQ